MHMISFLLVFTVPGAFGKLPAQFCSSFSGASFTRFQTLRLQKVFPEVLNDSLISYGSCQFPTLGFVVERYKQVQAFVPEPFWKIRGKQVACIHTFNPSTCVSIVLCSFIFGSYPLIQHSSGFISFLYPHRHEDDFDQMLYLGYDFISVVHETDEGAVEFMWNR